MSTSYGKIIDVWSQPPSGSFTANLPEVTRLIEKSGQLEFLTPSLKDPSWKFPPSDALKLMDEAGIDKMCFSAWARPGKWLVTNDDVAEYVKYNPRRFIGFGTVMLNDPVEAVKEIDRCVNVLGFKALRVVSWLWNLPPNDKLYYPLYVKLIEHDIPICLQAGHTGPLMPSETGRPVPYIDEVALTFPRLKIVCGHIGFPWTEEMIGVAWKHDNVFIDTSAYLPRYYPPQLLQYMQTYGKDKVMFGTNFPQLAWKRCTKQALELGLPPDVEEKFLWKNAVRVFKLQDPVTPKL